MLDRSRKGLIRPIYTEGECAVYGSRQYVQKRGCDNGQYAQEWGVKGLPINYVQ